MQELSLTRPRTSTAHIFACGFLAACAAATLLIGSFPLTASIVTIFLFAGPHNVMEFRYFLARMPRHWGRSKAYYITGIVGVLLLTASYLAIFFASDKWLWTAEGWTGIVASWNTLLLVWIGVLLYLRGRQRPRSDWSWSFAVVFLLAALVWAVPAYWSLALVYLHPLVALWFLDRQIRRTKPDWLRAYRACLMSIPVFLAIIWLARWGGPDAVGDSPLFIRISEHAGSSVVSGISSQVLIASHVFLESIHYAVWLLIIPLVDRRAVPWRLSEIPLLAGPSRPIVRSATLGVGVAAVLVVLILWAGFAVDYATARDIYFAFAIGHVVAEVPFLIKML